MVTFVDVTRTNRFVLLNDGRVDMLAARTTHTMERDTFEVRTMVLVIVAKLSQKGPLFLTILFFLGDNADWIFVFGSLLL